MISMIVAKAVNMAKMLNIKVLGVVDAGELPVGTTIR